MLVSVAIELCVDRALLYKPNSNIEEGERRVLTLKYAIAWVFHCFVPDCNCLLLYVIPENKQENTHQLYVKTINEHLD